MAAIRGWLLVEEAGITDEIYEHFKKIADSRNLPKGATLKSISAWHGTRGYAFEVWWVDLAIKIDDTHYPILRIRDQKISSRRMTKEELDYLNSGVSD